MRCVFLQENHGKELRWSLKMLSNEIVYLDWKLFLRSILRNLELYCVLSPSLYLWLLWRYDWAICADFWIIVSMAPELLIGEGPRSSVSTSYYIHTHLSLSRFVFSSFTTWFWCVSPASNYSEVFLWATYFVSCLYPTSFKFNFILLLMFI